MEISQKSIDELLKSYEELRETLKRKDALLKGKGKKAPKIEPPHHLLDNKDQMGENLNTQIET